jgi:hypothetical protein
MKKSTKALIIIAAALLLTVTLCSVAVSAFAYLNTREIKNQVAGLDEKLEKFGGGYYSEERASSENDVTIAGEYVIRDTSAISDAYISGDSSALDDRQKETLAMASDILKEIVNDGMTPFEKEKAVYEWLTSHINNENGMLTVIPTTSEECDDPYGVLKYRSAVCVGYATTFRLFMHMLGIECMVVHDTSLSHSWDEVKLDGEWYMTDCYFDSNQGSYRSFNVNNEILSQDHEWDKEFFPKAEGLKYNVAVSRAEEMDDLYALPAAVYEKMNEGEKCFAFRFGKSYMAENESAAAYMASMLCEYSSNGDEPRDVNYYWCREDDGDYVLCMFVYEYNDDIIEDDLTQETVEKIQKALEDVFGELYYDYEDYRYDDHGFIVGGVG